MSLEEIVADLLLRWQKDPYATLGPEDLCREYRDHPQHAEILAALQRRIRELREVGDDGTTSQDAATVPEPGERASPPSQPTWTAPGLRYRPVSFHARGGLGEVFRADDEELHREVALKRIQERYHGDPESCRRFLREAEITARLQHPGVVPVHGLGRDADGQLCYAMRFVEGGTLDDAIKRFHAADRQPGRDPGERRLALRELLGRFLGVCNTVAYAHSRGVLHRDLKPGNIMLGPYGETLVVDWGLAKWLGRTEEDRSTAESTPGPARGADGEGNTEVGHALGTPAYMSPEQAAGRWDVAGPASDVFSLGATLYALLTGQVPFRGVTNHDVLTAARRCDFRPPRQVKKDVPRVLEAVCLKAMAREPEWRYATPLELAADVEHWLADEPVGAYREPWGARAGRYLRRHRAMTVGVATGLVLVVVGLSAWMVIVSAHNRELTAVNQSKQEALDIAEDELAQLNTLYSEIGDIGKGKTALAAYHNALAALGRLVSQYPERTQYQRLLVQGHFNLGALHKDAGRLGDAVASYKTALELAGRFRDAFPDTARLRQLQGTAYHNLGNLYADQNRRALAEENFKEALKCYEALAESGAAEARVDVARTRYCLGNLLADLPGRAGEARDAYQQAINLLRAAATANPQVLPWRADLGRAHYNLAKLHSDAGRGPEAEDACKAALDIQRSLASRAPDVPQYQSDLATTLNLLGSTAVAGRRYKDALTSFSEALEIRRHLAEAYPTLSEYQSDLAQGLSNIAFTRTSLNDPAGAQKGYEEAIAVQRKLVAAAPAVAGYQADLGTFLNNLSTVLIDDGKLDAAEEALLAALTIHERLARKHPDVAAYLASLAGVHQNLGALLAKRGRPATALAWLDHAIVLFEEAQKGAPDNALVRSKLSTAGVFRIPILLAARLAGSQDAVADWDHALSVCKDTDRDFLRAQHAAALARRGSHAEAAAEAAILARGDPGGEVLLALARAYAAAAPAALKDAHLSADRRKELSGRYADEAAALLRRAHKAGWFAVAERKQILKVDPDFQPLASRPDLRELLAGP